MIKEYTMNTAAIRKQISLRLDSDLLVRLQEEAKRHNRSVNNLIESILQAFFSEKPNEITMKAIEEARSGKLRNQPAIDTSSVESMFKSMGL